MVLGIPSCSLKLQPRDSFHLWSILQQVNNFCEPADQIVTYMPFGIMDDKQNVNSLRRSFPCALGVFHVYQIFQEEPPSHFDAYLQTQTIIKSLKSQRTRHPTTY